jgi:hypothetical protein
VETIQRCRYEKVDCGNCIVFPSIKRVLDENLLSKKFKAQKIEAGLKVMFYNKFMGL